MRKCLRVLLVLELAVSVGGCCLVDRLALTLLRPHGLLCPWGFPGMNTGVGCHFLLYRTFPPQGLNLHFLYCMQILYH